MPRFIPDTVVTGCLTCPKRNILYCKMKKDFLDFELTTDGEINSMPLDFLDPTCPLPTRNSDEMREAMKRVLDQLSHMSKEEIHTLINFNEEEKCMPDTCHGECQGMGWCYTCEEFRGTLPDNEMEDLLA